MMGKYWNGGGEITGMSKTTKKAAKSVGNTSRV